MVTAIIQARMGSTRLPGKVMMKINDEPMLYYVIKQVMASKNISEIIIATTYLPEDDVIEEYVNELGYDVFRGDSDDILDRYYKCAKNFNLKTIVRITSDDPLIDPFVVDACIEKFQNEHFDYVSNTISKKNDSWIPNLNGFPYGIAIEVFNFSSLFKAWKNSKNLLEREHLSPYFIKNPNIFKLGSISNPNDCSNIRVTVDYSEDFDFVKSILTNFEKNEIITIEKIVSFVKKNPELSKLNNKFVFNENFKFQ